jgi:hypothetical protein
MASTMPDYIYQFFLHSHEMKSWSGTVFRLARRTRIKENVTGQIIHAVVTRPDGYEILIKSVDTIILLAIFKVAETALQNNEERKRAEDAGEKFRLSKIRPGPFADILSTPYPKGLTMLERSMFLALFRELSRIHYAIKVTKKFLKPSLKQIAQILNDNRLVTTFCPKPVENINWKHIHKNIKDLYDVIPEWEVQEGVRVHLKQLKLEEDKRKPKPPPNPPKERPKGHPRNRRF